MKRIIYQADGRPVSVIIPCECGLSIEQIGEKDVPHGLHFWIVDTSSIPVDRTFRESWELDNESLGTPSGIGGKV